MKITFEPKTMDFGEAVVILGMALPAFAKGCHEHGDTLEEVQAGMAELLADAWPATIPQKPMEKD